LIRGLRAPIRLRVRASEEENVAQKKDTRWKRRGGRRPANPMPGFNARLPALLTVLIPLAAIYGISTVRHSSAELHRAQVILARLDATTNRQSLIESNALQLGVVEGLGGNPALERSLDALPGDISSLEREVDSQLTELERLGPTQVTAEVVELAGEYEERLGTQVELLQEREFDQAFQYDRHRVDAAFDDLRGGLGRASSEIERGAQRAGLVADVGTAAVVLFAVLVLVLLQHERNKWAKEMAHRALHDPLTKLANRVLLRDRVDHALQRSARNGDKHALLFLDLDNFKAVNDTLGHECGDALLVGVAERVEGCVRPSDTVARLGGDEFAVLCESIEDRAQAERVSRRLVEALSAPFEIRSQRVTVGASVGIAICDQEDRVEDILANADVAMYAAKASGKGGCEIYEPDMRRALLMRVDIEADLQRALEKEEFFLEFQPIVEVQSGKVAGAEALVRWNHPARGLIRPNDFIPLAEQTGMIRDLGAWVLRQACRQAKQWQDSFPTDPALKIAVNLSAAELARDELVDDVRQVLSESGMPASCVILEVTESMLMRNTEHTIDMLKKLKETGVRLAVDDFGTGYSSLSYLTRFPIDAIKIDKDFVDGIERGAEEAALVRAIIHMGESLGLQTVAEGIETLEQLTELRRLGCSEGQGFFLARPLAIETMAKVLAASAAGEPLAGGFAAATSLASV
jgi:diguanylate cyclase (GGDEF)-like protein